MKRLFYLITLLILLTQIYATEFSLRNKGNQTVDINEHTIQTFILKEYDHEKDIVLTVFPTEGGNGFEKLVFTINNINNYKCTIDTMYGFCVITTDQIKEAQKLRNKGSEKGKYVVTTFVQCMEGPCQFDLQMSNEYEIFVDDEHNQITLPGFRETKIQLFNLYIPSTVERLIVKIQFSEFIEQLQENQVQIEELERSDYIQKHVYGDQIILEFRGLDNNIICIDCDYKIQVLSFQQSTKVDVTAYYYMRDIATLNLKSGQAYYDSILQDTPQIYKIKALENYKFISFDFKFSNENVHSSIVLNASVDNKQTISALEKNTIETAKNSGIKTDFLKNKDFTLVLSQDDAEGSFQGKEIHLVIYSFVSGFFTLEVNGYNNEIQPVYVDQIVAGQIMKGKNDYFLLKTPNLLKSDTKKHILVEINAFNFKNDLMIKKLQNEQQYAIQTPQTSEFQIQKKNNLISSQIEAVCEEEKEYCYFEIFIQNNDEKDHMGRYQMELKYVSPNGDDHDEIYLPQNKAFSDTIQANEYKDYFLKFDNSDASVESIELSITGSGLSFYTSPASKCVKVRPEDQRCKIKRGNHLNPIRYTKLADKTLVLAISVKANERATDFTIVAEIVKKIDEPNVLELTDAHSISQNLNNKTPFRVFNYYADLLDEEDLIINLKCPAFKCVMVVNTFADEDIPNMEDPTTYRWISKNNFLRIPHTSKKGFIKKGLYTITVEGLDNMIDRLDSQNMSIPFNIMVSGSKSLKVVDFNEAFFDSIYAKKSQYYEIVVNPKQIKNVYLSRNILNDETVHSDLIFYIDNEIKQNESDYAYVFKGEDTATFEVTSKVLKKLCSKELNPEYCSLYLAVQNRGLKTIQYSLTIWEQEIGIELKDGLQYQYTLYDVDGYMNFYYVPTHNQYQTTFHLYSYFGLTNFTMKVFDNKHNLPVQEWPFPKDNYGILEGNHISNEIDYTSGVHHTHTLSLSAQQMNKLSKSSVILISVGFMAQDNQGTNLQKKGKDQFTIVVSTIFEQIHEGERSSFTLEEGERKYMFLNLRNIIKQKENISLQLTTLSGYASMAVAIRDDKNDRIPVIENNDFHTFSNYLSVPFSETEKILKLYNMSLATNPTLVIQIQAWERSGHFAFGLYTDHNTHLDILHGLPQEIHLQKQKQRVFRYYNYMDEDIQVRVARNFGLGFLGINSCIEWEDCIENQGEMTFLSGETGSLVEIKKGGSLWCKDCFYMIIIKSYDISDFHGFLYVLMDNDAIWLQEGRTILDNNDEKESNLYVISVPQNEDVDLNMMVYWGNPYVYVNYFYELDQAKYHSGPFKKGQNNQININIPAKQDIQDSYSKINFEDEEEKNDELYLTENSFYSNIIENQIYILVVNPDKSILASNYTIGFTAESEERFITDGHILPIVLKPQETKQFIYQYYDNQAQTIISINLENHHEINIEQLQVSCSVHEQETRLENNKNAQKKEVVLQLLARSREHLTYAMPKVQGDYNFVIKNPLNRIINLTMYINARDMTLVPLAHQITHYLIKDSINYYEFIIPKNGFLSIDFSHCMGIVHLGFSQNYQKFIDHKFDDETAQPSYPGNNYLDIVPVKQGNFYLAVMSDPDEDAFYKFKTHLYKNQEGIPHYKIDAGGDGYIMVDRSVNGQINLDFAPLQCSGCNRDEYDKSVVLYKVIYSTDLEFLNIMGKCELTKFFDHDYKDVDQNKLVSAYVLAKGQTSETQFSLGLNQNERIKHSFTVQDTSKDYYVTIKAILRNFPEADGDIEVTYNNVKVSSTMTFGETIEHEVLVVIGAILVLFSFSVVCLLCRRLFRKSNIRNNFQIQRNIELNREHVSILDNSQPSLNESGQGFRDMEIFQQESDRNEQDFTFSKKISRETGAKQFNKFEDEI